MFVPQSRKQEHMLLQYTLNLRKPDLRKIIARGWCIKFMTGLNIINRHSSKSIIVIKLSFCQNDPLIGESFWQKDSLITCILFELCLFWYSAQSQIWCTTLYYYLGTIKTERWKKWWRAREIKHQNFKLANQSKNVKCLSI